MHNITVYTFTENSEFQNAVLERITKFSQIVIAQNRIFHIALTGGETAKSIYPKFLDLQTDWSKWHFWFGDERVLSEEDKGLNSSMAEETFLKYLSCKDSQIHKIPVSLGAESAADIYSRELQTVEIFDLILLGLGEDGHIASLFPGQDWGKSEDAPGAIAVQNSPKPPSERVSLSFNRINRSRSILVFTKGLSKKEVIDRIRNTKDTILNLLSPIEKIEIFYLLQ